MKSIIDRLTSKQDLQVDDNLKTRKINTQLKVSERMITFIIVIIVAVGISLMSFESIRQIGVSVLTSAVIVGIIIGFTA